MQTDGFEWDDAKAAANAAKHGVTFETSMQVFDDPLAVEWDDDSEPTEDRYFRIGMADDRLIAVSFTYRAQRVRIISARGAEPSERRKYHE